MHTLIKCLFNLVTRHDDFLARILKKNPARHHYSGDMFNMGFGVKVQW